MSTVAELEEKYPGFQWRYVGLLASVKHAIQRTSTSGQITGNSLAICGNSPHWSSPGWLGTGKQEEYEKLDQLRECKKCMKVLENPR